MKLDRLLVTLLVLSSLVLAACNHQQGAAPADAPHATVTLQNGTRVEGTVVNNSLSDVTIAGDDGIKRTIPVTQISSLQYGGAPSSAASADTATTSEVPASQPSTNPKPVSKPVSRPAPAIPAPVQPSQTRVDSDGEIEAHTHALRAQITTKTYEVPVGSTLSVRTEETIDSGKAVEGQTFAGEVTDDVRDADGAVVIPRGANAQIVIKSASKGGRFRGASDLVVDLKEVAIEGQEYQISTSEVSQQGKSGIGANKRTAIYTGGGAALGAIIGAIAGGGKGAAIGAGAGGGGGALTQILTKGGSIRIPVETVLTFQLEEPLHVQAAQ